MSSILSSHERSVSQTLLAVHYSIHAIARFLKRSPTTIAYEIKRVSPYNAEIAQQLSKENRQRRGPPRLCSRSFHRATPKISGVTTRIWSF